MRSAEIQRDTKETQIRVRINLDGTGKATLATGIPFLEHMLDQVARHGMLDLEIEARGDLHIDAHHTVEDIGITLGQAFAKAIGDKAGVRRYGHAYVPLDEALSPRRLSMCSVTWAWLTKPWKNSRVRSASNSPIRARVNSTL